MHSNANIVLTPFPETLNWSSRKNPWKGLGEGKERRGDAKREVRRREQDTLCVCSVAKTTKATNVLKKCPWKQEGNAWQNKIDVPVVYE